MEDQNEIQDLRRFSHVHRQASPNVQRRIEALKVGQKMQDLPEELWHASFRFYVKEDPNRKGGPNLRMIRLDPEQPSLTVTGFIFNKFVHPYEDRFITAREAARLQGFPDWYMFIGSLTSVQRQIGNAVPVQMARAIGTAILRKERKIHPSGNKTLRVLSLFSGAGGLDLGFFANKCDGINFEIDGCVEYDHDSCETLRHNFGAQAHNVIEGDIRMVMISELLRERSKDGFDVVIGGPPCQSFSQAGKQKGINDDRGQLIEEYIRMIHESNPRYFVFENVSNLKSIGRGELLSSIVSDLRGLGYNCEVRVLSASDYGTPQKRRRLVILGCRKELGTLAIPSPTHGAGSDLQPFTTVEDAFHGLPQLMPAKAREQHTAGKKVQYRDALKNMQLRLDLAECWT